MKPENRIAWLTLWVDRAIMILVAILVVAMPAAIDWLRSLRPMGDTSAMGLLIAFYLCVPMVLLALWRLDEVLRNIMAERVFVPENVACIRAVRWCCLGVSLVCLPGTFFYPPLLFLAVIMGFLSLVVNVMCQVMKAAVALREENDLTV